MEINVYVQQVVVIVNFVKEVQVVFRVISCIDKSVVDQSVVISFWMDKGRFVVFVFRLFVDGFFYGCYIVVEYFVIVDVKFFVYLFVCSCMKAGLERFIGNVLYCIGRKDMAVVFKGGISSIGIQVEVGRQVDVYVQIDWRSDSGCVVFSISGNYVNISCQFYIVRFKGKLSRKGSEVC